MLGRMLFYLTWPLIWVYAPLTRRVRVVAIHKGKVLVVKNWFGANYWQLPGGGIRMGETVTDAAHRELSEELGLKSKKLVELHEGTVIIRQFGLLMRYHFVFVELEDPSAELVVCRALSSAEWFDIDKLTRVSVEVVKGLSLVSKQG